MKKISLASGFIFTCQILSTKVAYAGWENNQLAQENAQVQSIFSDCLRWLIWQVLMVCYRCCRFFENTLDYIFKITPDFTANSQFNELMNAMWRIGWCFVTVILVYLGIKQMTKSGFSVVKQAIINFAVILVVLGSLKVPIANGKTLIPLLADLSQNAIGVIIGGDGQLALSEQSILDNLVDVKVAYDSNGSKPHNLTLQSFNPEYLDYNEQLAANDVDGKFPVFDQQSGTWTTKKIATGVWGWFDTNVYRWNVKDPFILMLQFIVMSLGFIFAGLKFIRLILELAFKQILLPFVGFIDLESGQRFKRLLWSIATTCLLMVIVVLVFRIYQIGNVWISNNFGLSINPSNNGTLSYLKFLGYLANTLLLLDGPKIVEEIFGMDAGISGDAVRTGSHMMNIGRNLFGGTKAISKGIKGGKDFITDENQGKWVKNQASKGLEKASMATKKFKDGMSEVAHFKGFDEEGNVMSSSPNHDLNNSESAKNRQSLAEMGKNAWNGTKAMANQASLKAKDLSMDMKTKVKDSDQVKEGVSKAKDLKERANKFGKNVVNTHLDQLQPKAQEIQAMNDFQQAKLAEEKEKFEEKQLERNKPKPKHWEEMSQSERFKHKWSQSETPVSTDIKDTDKSHKDLVIDKLSQQNLSQGENSLVSMEVKDTDESYKDLIMDDVTNKQEVEDLSKDKTWKDDLKEKLIENGQSHLIKGYDREQKKQDLKQRLKETTSNEQTLTNEQRMDRVKRRRSKEERQVYKQFQKEEREW